LNLKCCIVVSNFGFKRNLCHYDAATNPGSVSTWAHDVSVFDAAGQCKIGGAATKMMGTDISMSSSIASFAKTAETYTYTIWTRTSKNKATGVGVRNTVGLYKLNTVDA
jgi:hypothetical protein